MIPDKNDCETNITMSTHISVVNRVHVRVRKQQTNELPSNTLMTTMQVYLDGTVPVKLGTKLSTLTHIQPAFCERSFKTKANKAIHSTY